MRLTHISVEGIGKFGTPARVEGLAPGINILAAGNEAGKSTLFKAIRTCLFERHGTRSSDVVSLATEGLSLPLTVSLGFTHDDSQYELTKSFLRSPSACLRRDGTEIARNREADELVWEILGIGSGTGRSVDDAAFGILWVAQGQSFFVPRPSEAATNALNAAIQQEVGTLVGGERAREVLDTLKVTLSRQLTERTNQPRTGGDLAEAARQVETTTGELQTAEERLRTLDESLDELARLRSELRRLSSPVEASRLKSDLETAIQQLKSAEEAEESLRRCEIEEQNALSLLKTENERVLALQELCTRIDSNRRRIEQIKLELTPLEDRKVAVSNAIASAYAMLRQLDDELRQLEDQELDLQRKLSLVGKVAKVENMRTRLDLLKQHDERAIKTEAILKSMTVDEAAIRMLDDIERDTAAFDASIKAAAAQVSIERTGLGRIALNEDDVESNCSRPVTEVLTIWVGDTAKVTITPPQTGFVAAQKQTSSLRLRMEQLLRMHGASTPEELRNARKARMQLEEEARALKAERMAYNLKEAPASEITRLSLELAQIDNELEQQFTGLAYSELPSESDVVERRNALTEKRQELRTSRVHDEGAIEGHNASLSHITAAQGALQGQLLEIDRQLAADVSQLDDGERKKRLDAADYSLMLRKQEHAAKAAALAEMRRNFPGMDEIERRRIRVNRLQDAIKNLDAKLAELSRSVAHIEGQVQIAGGDGLGERVAELSAQLECQLKVLQRQTSRVDTLKLLRQVVEQCFLRRKEQLQAPLRRHLKPFLNDVFPEADIELGDGFSISGLRRHGPDTESFEKLSKGTQEQIAVLVRLAMGAMIGERGQEVPVILDDALVFSDDERIEQMFDALKRAARSQQILILTCRSRTFASLGGQQLQILR